MSQTTEYPVGVRSSSTPEAWLANNRQPGRHHVGLAFSNLDCYGFTSNALYQSTVASYAFALPKRLIALISQKFRPRVHILRDFEGLIQPQEMLLVLGRPGSGCSTFLKTLAGETHGFRVGDGHNINYGGSL